MHTIYFENRSIVLCTRAEVPCGVEESSVREADGLGIISSLLGSFGNSAVARMYLVNEDADTCFGQFCSLFNEIDAGGGVVCNSDGKFLLIRRRGLWDLPKGKREEGEDIGVCAVREVMEETGLEDVALGNFICTTHHTYMLDGRLCIKHTYWYRMSCEGCPELVPQTEEEITDACWMDHEAMRAALSTSYPSIREVTARLV